MAQTRESISLLWLPLGVLTLLFSATPLGYIPVMGTARFITIAHIPVILGAILKGPLTGAILGLLFGLGNTWYVQPHNPWLQILPRTLSGLVAGVTFVAISRYGNPHSRLTVGSLAAAVVGSLTNTLGVTLGAACTGIIPSDEVLSIIIFHGSCETLLAVMITLPITIAGIHSRR